MTPRATILIVDDEISNIEIINAALDDEYEICFAMSGEEAIKIALAVIPDLILLDVLLPGIDGYEVCRTLKDNPLVADVPIIFITALGDQQAEMRGLSLGAIDYVTKPMSPFIVRARVRNHIELKRLRDKLAELSVTDALTGLSNRRHLEQVLDREVARLARASEWLSVIMVDIDFFKPFNDAFGHPEGDRCLAMVAAAMHGAVRRAADLAARYGGEEFTCVLPGADHPSAIAMADTIRHRVKALGIPHVMPAAGASVTVSLGVGTARCVAGMAPELWIKAADRQLYLAKRAGRNRVAGAVFDFTPLMPGDSIAAA